MKYLYTAVFLLFLSQGNAAAQEKSGFFDKIKGTFSSEIKIGTYTFKDGSVYTGEIKGTASEFLKLMREKRAVVELDNKLANLLEPS